MNNNDITIDMGLGATEKHIIKVIGVGGGGGNAVNHMYKEGIHEVDFLDCNTDAKALKKSSVPNKLQLGAGLGAGGKPEIGRQLAEESLEEIRTILNDGTQMVFITTGMGGGTGTGAAPVIAREAKNMGILTVGVVTIPFLFEREKRILKALDGVEEIAQNVDALLVINNERLREIYSDLTFANAFAKADDILSYAVRSIADIITMSGRINLDFNDVRTVLKDGGVAIMSSGLGEGEHRVTDAIKKALESPLLNNTDVFKSKRIIIYVVSPLEKEGNKPFMMEEMDEISSFMGQFEDRDIDVKFGQSEDKALTDKIKVVILASGFGMSAVPGMTEKKQHDEAVAAKELEKKNNDDSERIGHYYGGGTGKPVSHRTVIFSNDDLDNPDFISAVEQAPVATRKNNDVENINSKKNRIGEEVSPLAEAAEDDDEASRPTTISFTGE